MFSFSEANISSLKIRAKLLDFLPMTAYSLKLSLFLAFLEVIIGGIIKLYLIGFPFFH